MRVETRRPKQAMTWLPDVLELFAQKGQLTSRELAAVVRTVGGGDAVTRCRQIGLPIKTVGAVQGGNNRKKLYILDILELWSALEASLKQHSRYARLLNYQDSGTRPTFRGAAGWIVQLRKTAKDQPEKRRQGKASDCKCVLAEQSRRQVNGSR
jgi:hypothetical protein